MKNLIVLLSCLVFTTTAFSQQTYWQQQLHYTIEVSLNDTAHSLNGFLKLRYDNHSPDSLSFIWFHLWPNAYKNDRTAFSEQLLENGRTDFYFSNKEKRGYINRLDFRVNNITLRTEDHPLYIDVIKVILQKPLAPGEEIEITTPFHVKLPYNFSRGGHVDQSYQATQWYPKPAVYDQKGWHPMPYLDQGEFYSEFGSYDVRISLPENYVVAATGDLQNEEEKKWLKERGDPPPAWQKPVKKFVAPKPKKPGESTSTEIKSSDKYKTLRYLQDNVHDFAWFADKYFGVNYDTIQLSSGRIIDAYSFYSHSGAATWKNSIAMIKDAVRFRSQLIGEYPFNVVSAVEAKMGFTGGMEYPTITSISPTKDEKNLDITIEHEVGHNWFYGILASNEREHPWLDEGLNSYYDNRYKEWKYPEKENDETKFPENRMPENEGLFLNNALAKEKKDQPIETPSADFTSLNYGLVAYSKTAWWLEQMEKSIGRDRFDSCMKKYYEQWKFKHPQPEDFLAVMQNNSGKDLSEFRHALTESGRILPSEPGPKKIKPTFLFNYRNTHKISYLNFLPAIGGNKYDGFMLGAAIHNFKWPAENFQFVVIPLYATASKQLNGTGGASYSWRPDGKIQKIQAGIGFSRFSSLKGIDSNGIKITGGFSKLTPSLRLIFKNKSARSSIEKWIEWKTFLIGETAFDYELKSTDSSYYPTKGITQNRYVNQLMFSVTDYRALYPYDIQVQLQQGEGFYRASVNGNYFLNYAKGGGASARFFGAKFGYLGEQTTEKEFETINYQPKLTAVRGSEDYTYSNYFIGRNESEGIASQQIMMRDGGLKLRTDLFQGLQGRSDNWIAAINLSTTIPPNILPKFIPLRIFLDVGTYAEAWEKESTTSRFLFVGGLQLSFIKGLVNVYAPLFYSSEFSDNLKTVPEENKFLRKISFSIDIQRFSLRKITNNNLPF